MYWLLLRSPLRTHFGGEPVPLGHGEFSTFVRHEPNGKAVTTALARLPMVQLFMATGLLAVPAILAGLAGIGPPGCGRWLRP